ncbi:MAG: ParB/RepB/Spo0J family partition protein [Desulfobacterales bacterium]|nr:ParB/RepB/Spo0J family partition protein [Desulfobacterales bacterium]MCP4164089.1 ParB/RepB/Spo0J family partition protein [Deltaproteobacteria bacterium]
MLEVDTEDIFPNKYQPRKHFAENELNELASSIIDKGVLQPLLVRKADIGYELIAGERRLRASKKAGLSKVPVVIKDITDVEMLEISIIENIQRENINPIEEGNAYNRLITEFNLTQEQVAHKVGKSRPAVANFLRLLKLPDNIKESIEDETISTGHARALLSLSSPEKQRIVWEEIIAKGLSVRATESLVKKINEEIAEPETENKPASDDIYISGLADSLSLVLGTKVSIKRKGDKGKLEIDFYSNDDLERLINQIKETL